MSIRYAMYTNWRFTSENSAFVQGAAILISQSSLTETIFVRNAAYQLLVQHQYFFKM